ncbi:OmpA family protein [Seongchinamella sediminis]|uniref:OmpA family protein n=1 Tax=Seongchinamella sediminis TaxID=2283635 RepID=A0A3L7DTP3_9GAMM|nr:OmpA family protein [Seongchinamella sediminis]RLQ20938.1 OmpA family protein [Seongchinamella sediminis]
MKNYPPLAVCSLFAAVLLAGCSGSTGSYETQPYVTNGGDTVVRVNDRQGRCIRTPDWTEETATRECDPELFPEPEPVAAAAAPSYEAMTLSASALFDFDSARLKDAGVAELKALGDQIRSRGASVVDIDIIGHTDSMGPEDYNQGLSERRATAIRDYLVNQRDVDPAIIDVAGMGEGSPVADNATAAGRAQNRRVEVRVGIKAPR